MEYEYLPLLKTELPCSKYFTFDDGGYTFLFRLNSRHDRIYMEIIDDDDNVIYTTRLIYFAQVIHAVVDGLGIEEDLIPFNIDDLLTDAIPDETAVTEDSLERIKIHVVT